MTWYSLMQIWLIQSISVLVVLSSCLCCTISHHVNMMFTWCSHDVYMMFTWCLHDVYMMFTWCLHDGYMMVTWWLHDVYIMNDLGCHTLVMLWAGRVHCVKAEAEGRFKCYFDLSYVKRISTLEIGTMIVLSIVALQDCRIVLLQYWIITIL